MVYFSKYLQTEKQDVMDLYGVEQDQEDRVSEDELLEREYGKRYLKMLEQKQKEKGLSMAKESASAGVNFLDPSTFIAGLTDDVDLEITAAKFEEYDFNGKAQPRDGKSGVTCAIHFTLDGEDGGEPIEQFWPCGPIENWQPTDDGEYVEAVGGKSGFYKYSAGSLLINAILGLKGMPKGILADAQIGVLVGYKLHWNQVPSERKGQDGKDKTLLLPTGFVSAPGRAAAKASTKAKAKPAVDDEDEDAEETPAPKGKGKAAATAKADDTDVSDLTISLATRAAENMDTPLTLEDFTSEIFELVSKEKGVDRKVKKEVIALVNDTDWIEEHAEECGLKWNAKKQTLTAV